MLKWNYEPKEEEEKNEEKRTNEMDHKWEKSEIWGKGAKGETAKINGKLYE